MKNMLGEPNTEQFEVVTRVHDKEVHRLKIHDPFVRTTTTLKGIGHAWRCLFGRGLRVTTFVNGTPGAMRVVMMLDPHNMEKESISMKIDRSVSQGEDSCQAASVSHSKPSRASLQVKQA